MLEPSEAIVYTLLSILGSQVPSSVLSDRIWAKWLRVTSPTFVKSPPTYHPPEPSGIEARTFPLILGGILVKLALPMDNVAPLPVLGPIYVKLPPT